MNLSPLNPNAGPEPGASNDLHVETRIAFDENGRPVYITVPAPGPIPTGTPQYAPVPYTPSQGAVIPFQAPPAVYGPHDREILELFRVARWGFVPLPPDGRLSVIAGEDLARLLLTLGRSTTGVGALYEPDDGVANGWDHRVFARAIGAAIGRRILPLSIPETLLQLGARADRLARGTAAKLTPDRVRYFCHPDWVVSADARPPAALWAPEVPTPEGLRATADWYRGAGLLK